MRELLIDASTQASIPPADPAAALARDIAEAANAGDLPRARAAALGAEALSPGIAVLFLLFQFHVRTGAHADALRVCHARVDRCRDGASASEGARAFGNLALIHLMMHDIPAAHAALVQALAMDEAHDDSTGLSRDLGTLGQLHEQAGEWHAARDAYFRALTHARRTGDPAHIATKLSNLGDVFMALGEPDEAADAWREALPLLQASGKVRWHAEVAAKLEALATTRNGPGGT